MLPLFCVSCDPIALLFAVLLCHILKEVAVIVPYFCFLYARLNFIVCSEKSEHISSSTAKDGVVEYKYNRLNTKII